MMAPSTAAQDADEAVRLADHSPNAALAAAEGAVVRARRERDTAAESTAERAWGHALMQCGAMDKAIVHLRRAVSSGERAGSTRLAAEAQMKLAFALVQTGHPHAALDAVETARRSLDGIAGARARAQRAIVLHQLGRLDEAIGDFRAALTMLRRAGDTLGVHRVLVNKSLVHIDRHDLHAAKADLEEAEDLARRLGLELCVGSVADDLGLVEGRSGDVPAALSHLARAEGIFRIHARGAQLGSVFRSKAELLLSVGLAAEASAAAEEAVTAYRRDRRALNVPEVRLLLAQAAIVSREYSTAIAHARRAISEFERQEREVWPALARLEVLRAQLASGAKPRVASQEIADLVRTLTRAGWAVAESLEARLAAARVARLRGDTAAERDHLLQMSRARRRGIATLRARGWYAEALLRQDAADDAGAARAARAGLKILDEHRAALGAADLRVHSARYRVELVELGLRTALRAGKPNAVFEWAERGRASRLLPRPVRPPDDPRLASLLSQLRARAAETGDEHHPSQLGPQAALEREIRDYVRQQPGVAQGTLPAPVSPRQLSGALGDCALLEFVQLDGELHGLSVVDGRLRLRSLGSVAAVDEVVECLPFALHRLARRQASTQTLAAARTLLQGAAAKLDALLLLPFAAEIADRPLVVVPTGPLYSVPWSTLPSCVGRPVVVSPSASLWHLTTTREDAGGEGVAVAAGPGLRAADEEAAAVADIYGTTPLVGPAATAEAVIGVFAAAALVHLAAHGRLSAGNPLFSSVSLADGPLVVYDLERLARVPRTVVLAACDSGRSMVYAGDELLGLGATFIERGVTHLVASVLPIPDAETAPLMIALHRHLASGTPPAAALAAAQQELGDEPAAVAAAAGFVCLGSGLSPAR